MADTQVKRKILVTQPRLSYPSSRPTSPTKSVTSTASPLKRSPLDTSFTKINSPEVAPRLRAKVSSSANVTLKKLPANLAPSSGSSTPRASSPAKQANPTKERLSPRPTPETLSRMRSRSALSAVSAPSSPRGATPPRVIGSKSTDASVHVARSDIGLSSPPPSRPRHSSISSVSALSSVSATQRTTGRSRSPASSAVSNSRGSDVQSNVSTTSRIKAKVTHLAKGKPPLPQTPPPIQIPPATCFSPPTPNTPNPSNVTHQTMRTVSIGSSASTSKRDSFAYPITTATPAANAHRYASVRISSASYRTSSGFPSPLQTESKPARADPTLIPLPPLSPPSSNLSFSSRSSVSRSSASSTSNAATPSFNLEANELLAHISELNSTVNGSRHNRSRNGSLDFLDENISLARENGRMSEPPHDSNNEDFTIRAEAKSHRKIADLEITTKSLLAINAQLEANKHKQAKEIRELRLKLRESRLVLPPRIYKQVNSPNDEENLLDDEEADDPEEGEREIQDDDALAEEGAKMGKEDEHFNRVRLMIDSLLESGRQALATKAEDFAPPTGTTKVLHEVEARSWRDGRRGSDLNARLIGDRDYSDEVSIDDTFVTAADYGDDTVPSRRVSAAGRKVENGDQDNLIRDARVSLNTNSKS